MKILLRIGLFCALSTSWVITHEIPEAFPLMVNPLFANDISVGEFTAPLERENIEFGIEEDYPIQNLSYFSNIQKYYLTCASTINRDATIKLKIGSLTADCKNTDTNKTIGEFKYLPTAITLTTSFMKPPLRPYLGGGYTHYHYSRFKPQDDAFDDYKGTVTHGFHLVSGVKYIPNKNISVNLDLIYEMVHPFRFKSRLTNLYPEEKLDLSNLSVGLNIALRF